MTAGKIQLSPWYGASTSHTRSTCPEFIAHITTHIPQPEIKFCNIYIEDGTQRRKKKKMSFQRSIKKTFVSKWTCRCVSVHCIRYDTCVCLSVIMANNNLFTQLIFMICWALPMFAVLFHQCLPPFYPQNLLYSVLNAHNVFCEWVSERVRETKKECVCVCVFKVVSSKMLTMHCEYTHIIFRTLTHIIVMYGYKLMSFCILDIKGTKN